jgi:hypothetical protein
MSLRTWEPGKTYFKHEQTPSVVTKAKRRSDKAEALSDAYAAVDKRDQSICRVTGRHTTPSAPDPRLRREHHHLSGRRVKPEWRHDPKRIVTVCKQAHDLITAGWIVVEGTDADKPHGLKFHWREGIDPKLKILVILSRRRSQREDA